MKKNFQIGDRVRHKHIDLVGFIVEFFTRTSLYSVDWEHCFSYHSDEHLELVETPDEIFKQLICTSE